MSEKGKQNSKSKRMNETALYLAFGNFSCLLLPYSNPNTAFLLVPRSFEVRVFKKTSGCFFFFLCYFQRTHLPRDSLSFLNLLDLNAWLPGSQPQPTNHHRSHYQSVYFSIYSLDTVQSSRILTFFF